MLISYLYVVVKTLNYKYVIYTKYLIHTSTLSLILLTYIYLCVVVYFFNVNRSQMMILVETQEMFKTRKSISN